MGLPELIGMVIKLRIEAHQLFTLPSKMNTQLHSSVIDEVDKLGEVLFIASTEFGPALMIKALRRQFADRASYVDEIIHEIIGLIEQTHGPEDFKIEVAKLVEREGEDMDGNPYGRSYGEVAIEAIIPTLQEWIETEEMTSDPWWAD
jgi:hypothetical protein